MILRLKMTHALARLRKDGLDDPIIDASIEQLDDSALLVDGLYPNLTEMVERIQQLMEAATDAKRITG